MAIGESTSTNSAMVVTTQPISASKTEVISNLSAMMALAANKQNGIIDLRESSGPIELYDKPKSTLLTTYGRNAADNANLAVLAYAFNEDTYNVSQDAANPATASKATAYNDGFNGKNINRHIELANNGRGLKMVDITFTALNAAGDQDPTILQQLDFTITTYTVVGGRLMPKVLDVSSAIRNTQFQSGILTLLVEAWINGVTQLAWNVPAGATVSANITWGN